VSNVIPFSQALRERTWTSHSESEGASFMGDLMSGKGTRDDYIALVAQHFFIYEAIEAAADRMKNDPVAAPFITSICGRKRLPIRSSPSAIRTG
jgi:heme oxygenase